MRRLTMILLMLAVVSSVPAADEFFNRARLGALAEAHEAFLDGDHKRVAPAIRDAIRDAAGDPEITRSGLALLEQLYASRKGQPIPVDFELHPQLERLKVSVIRRENPYWTEYGLRVWGKEREAGMVTQIRLTHATGEVVLDRNQQRGTWWTLEDAEDGPEFELAFWENGHPPAEGLYDLHMGFADGSHWEAWFILSNAVASKTPSPSVPEAGAVLTTSRPTFAFGDFRTPEYKPFERRSLWYRLSKRSDSRTLQTHWEMNPTRTGIEVEQTMPDGDYTLGLFYAEARRFGPIVIGRTAGTIVPFTIQATD